MAITITKEAGIIVQTTHSDADTEAATSSSPQSPATSQTDLTLRSLTIDQWQQFTESHPDRGIFHHRHWLELLQQQYGMRLHLPALVRGGEVVAGAAFLRTRSLTGRRRYVALPFTDSVNVLVCSTDLKGELLAAMRTDPILQRSSAVLIRTCEPLGDVPPESRAVIHRLDLARSFADVQAGFSKSTRGDIRRAERCELRCAVSTDADSLEAYYRLHVTTRRRLGVPVQPRSFFRRIQSQLIDHGLGVVGLVCKDGVPVAGGVFFGYNGVLTVKYLASDPSALGFRPNECLVFNMIGWAIEHGYTTLSFGLSDREQTGLRRFKQKWGAVESDLFLECISGRNDKSPHDSRLLKAAGVVIRNSPPLVCRALGELFYRYSS